jgi:hypothetical protein
MLFLGGCFGPDASTCGSLVCPAGSVCSADESRCIANAQLAACRGVADGADCIVSDANGTCREGVCEPWHCGDQVRNGGETCDGDDLGGVDCRRFGFANPDGLVCGNSCNFDFDGCGSSIQLVSNAFERATFSIDTLAYDVSVPAGDGLFLLVSVILGVYDCSTDDSPAVVSVTSNGTALVPVAAVVGSPCSAIATRTEQWRLVAPSVGMNHIEITLERASYTAHSAAFVFTGVDQDMPIHATAQMTGVGTSASLDIVSAPGDVVVDIVSHGNSILGAGADQMVIYVRNGSPASSGDNSSASWGPGASPSVTRTWTFGADDEWQLVASSLRRR